MPKRINLPDILRCSFCNKTQNEVSKLIAGPSVFICDECVEVCRKIMAEDAAPVSASEPVESDAPVVACALCHMHAPSTDALFIEARGALCPTCVEEIEAAIAARSAPGT